jgi:hypothetical protein
MQLIDGLICQPTQRRAEHADKGQPVVWVLNCSEQIHGIDDFLGGVKVSLSLYNIANAVAPKRLQVIVDVGELSEKDGNILRLRPNQLSTRVENGGSFYDLVFEPTGQTLAFDSARFFRAHVFVSSDYAARD